MPVTRPAHHQSKAERKVIAMPLNALPDEIGFSGRLADPGYWLVAGLDWPPGRGPAKAALAVAPELIPREAVSQDTYQVLGCADLYAARRATRVVFLSDLTRMFARVGQSWASLHIDWRTARDELHDGSAPALSLTITQRAHMLICEPPSDPDDDRWHDQHELVHYERELIRHVIADKLAADWPAYLTSIGRARRLRVVS
jgi:hypothetical protein